jgi:hypothetical protein
MKTETDDSVKADNTIADLRLNSLCHRNMDYVDLSGLSSHRH